MKTTAIKTLNGFIYGNLEQYEKIPMGATVGVEYSKSRNYENHKRFFAFIDTVFDMQDFFNDKEMLRKYLTMKAGYFTSLVTPNGSTIFIADSIAFEKMDEVEFKEMFSKCINVSLKLLTYKCTEEELMKIIGFG